MFLGGDSLEFKYNMRDLKFILKEWLPMDDVLKCERFSEYYGIDDIDPILSEGYKVAREVVSPINVEGDKNPVAFADGVVTSPPGYKEVYQFLQKNGWGSSSECVEMDGGMPLTLYKGVAEMIAAACPAMGSNIKLTSGAANLIIKFGTEDDKKRFLPKMLSGEWQGTMNLTEPSAGSDVGDALARSYPTDDPKIWKIKGTKMFITAGDGSLCENTIHMVLARPPEGAKGSPGLGLYVVPKYWVDENGAMGKFNDVTTIAIEHKMGLNGSATCMLNYGENDECYGIMLGSAPDEKGRSKGLAMMFNMMNESRIGTGHNANNQASAAYALASQYAVERVQGYKGGERVTIIKHEDVRRMLLDMKAHTEGIRAMIFKGFWNLDIAENDADKAKAKDCADFAAILTPLIKCYGSETTVLMTAEAIQVLGGVGYTKEYPVEQYMRDSKVLTIWEGTSFIHGNDLVGRKMTMENGEPFKKWMTSIKSFADANKNNSDLSKEFSILERAYASAEEVIKQIYAWQAAKANKFVNAFAIRTLFVFAQLYVATCLLEQAVTCQKIISGLPADHYDMNFYKGKIYSARYYTNNILPNVFTLAEVIKGADESVFEVPEEILIIDN
jgi:alkylation response protein AidB-like acyl-CoA dehydrogenase